MLEILLALQTFPLLVFTMRFDGGTATFWILGPWMEMPAAGGRAINSRGQIVGGSSDCRNFLHAFVWEDGGPMLDLNTLIPSDSGLQLTNAFNINDRGEILVKSLPLGVSPIDDEDLGHVVLLIPCEGDDDCKSNAPQTMSSS